MLKFLVSKTYSETTPESVEHGDFSDTGFVFCDEVYTLSELKCLIKSEGFSRERNTGGKKSSPCSSWLSTGFETKCYKTGTDIEYNLHAKIIQPAHPEALLVIEETSKGFEIFDATEADYVSCNSLEIFTTLENAKTHLNKIQPIESITVVGRRWFQKSMGSTYNTVEISINNGSFLKLPFCYGYGNYYIQRAVEFLAEKNVINPEKSTNTGSTQPLWRYCKENDIKLHDNVYDVPRKKDL